MRLTYFFIFLSIIVSAMAEEIETTSNGEIKSSKARVVKKNLKVYLSPDKTVYWPIDLPFFVRLATSKDAKESFLLSKFHSSVDEDKEREVTKKGIKLEQPGSQFIRWVNNVTKDSIYYKFVADDGGPDIKIEFLNSKKYESSNGLFMGPGLKVNLVANDEHSGVDRVYYNLNRSKVLNFKTPINFFKEGLHQIDFSAVDKVGYRSKIKNSKFFLDKTPPIISHEFGSMKKTSILGKGNKIKLLAQDKLSGVKNIFYKFDDAPGYQMYEEPIDTLILQNGYHVIFYYAKDNVDNISIANQAQFFYDTDPPEIALGFLGPFAKNNDLTYLAPDTEIKLIGNDTVTKQVDIQFKIDDSKIETYVTPLKFKAIDNLQQLEYFALDEFKNRSTTIKFGFKVDYKTPQSFIKFQGNYFQGNDSAIYINSKTAIEIESKDEGSGVDDIFVHYNSTSPKKYTGPLTIGESGKVLFSYWAQDKVKNREKNNGMILIVDNAPPRVVLNYSSRIVASVDNLKKKVPVNTLMSINPVDDQSGVKGWSVKIGDENPVSQLKYYRFEQSGKHKVLITVIDNVGNETKQTFEVNVSK